MFTETSSIENLDDDAWEDTGTPDDSDEYDDALEIQSAEMFIEADSDSEGTPLVNIQNTSL